MATVTVAAVRVTAVVFFKFPVSARGSLRHNCHHQCSKLERRGFDGILNTESGSESVFFSKLAWSLLAGTAGVTAAAIICSGSGSGSLLDPPVPTLPHCQVLQVIAFLLLGLNLL